MFDRNKMRELMYEKGYGNNQFAHKIGATNSHISNILNGNIDIRVSTLEKICRALGCTPNDLIC